MKQTGFFRFLCMLCAVLLSAGLLTGCGESSVPDVYPVHVEGSIFGGAAGDSIAAELCFDPAWITRAGNKKYNADLAAFSALLCADSYYREKDLAKGTQNRVLVDGVPAEEYTFTTLLDTVGFTEVLHMESFREKEYALDGNDSVTLTLAHRVTDGKYDSYVVVIRGCFSAQEWVSAFDPGADTAAYTDMTGEHPEWTEPAAFKGFAIAAERAKEFIDAFMAENNDPALPDCILFTGHSRGGAIANLLGAFYEFSSDAKTYTYTFNAPAVIEKSALKRAKTVFNLFDSGDFYTDPLPFSDPKPVRYGKDLTLDIASDDAVKTAVAALKGRDDYASAPADVLAAYKKDFAAAFPTRASLYETKTVTETFADKAEAEKRLAEIETLIGADGLDLGMYCTPGTVTKTDSGYELGYSYCGAVFSAGLSKVLAYGSAAYDALNTLFREDSRMALVTTLYENAAALSGGHLLVNGYVMTQYVK